MKREIKIGVFTVLMILVAWGGIRFLSGIDLLSSNSDYYAHYTKIDGIQNASPIFVKGVKVGTVTGISLDEESMSEVKLTLTIANKYKIPKDTKAKIFTNGLMGGKAVDLTFGSSSEYLEAGDVIESSSDADLFEVAGTELTDLKTRIETVTNELTETLSGINTLLKDNSENISGFIANMNALSNNLNSLVEHNSKNITTMIDGFSEVSDTLGNNSAQIDSIIRNVNCLTMELSKANLGESLSSSLTQIDSLMMKINNSDGNVGKILNDEALYDNLASASANLDSLLYDVKKNPKRYVNISVFGSNETKAQAKLDKKAKKEAEKQLKKQ